MSAPSTDRVTAARWRLTDHARPVNVGWNGSSSHTRSLRVAHLVRGQHTLCGRNASRINWADDPLTGGPATEDRCVLCLAVPDGHLTHHDMLDAAGITYRQLDYWARQRYLRADNDHCGSGTRRTFPPDELAVAVEIARLIDAGVRVDVAATLARGPGDLDVAWAAQRGECS